MSLHLLLEVLERCLHNCEESLSKVQCDEARLCIKSLHGQCIQPSLLCIHTLGQRVILFKLPKLLSYARRGHVWTNPLVLVVLTLREEQTIKLAHWTPLTVIREGSRVTTLFFLFFLLLV